jgi:hypothetical protein
MSDLIGDLIEALFITNLLGKDIVGLILCQPLIRPDMFLRFVFTFC